MNTLLINRQQEKKDKDLREFLKGLDYNIFLIFIIEGNITGQRLITLCSVSKKFREYSNRSFQLRDIENRLIGKPQDQYLFRILLSRLKIDIPLGSSPKETYIKNVIGGEVWAFGSNKYHQLGLGSID
jgi:hypothetical protein